MLFENGRPVALAPRVIETLVALIERGGAIVSKDELMQRVWGESFVEESNLTQNIYLLRKALGNNPAGEPLIESFRRRGYRFNGELTAGVATPHRNGIAHDSVSGHLGNGHDGALPRENTNGFRLSGWHVAAVIAFLGVAALTFAGFYTRKAEDPPPVAVAPPTISIKRLTPDLNVPFAALSPDAKYVAYVLREDAARESVWLMDIATGSSKQIAPPSRGVGFLRFSPDGEHIYVTNLIKNRHGIFRIPFSGGPAVKIAEDNTSPFTISPDGKQIAFIREQACSLSLTPMTAGTSACCRRVT